MGIPGLDTSWGGLAALTSLGMTPPLIVMCLGVVWYWWETAVKAARAAYRTPAMWITIGVALGFIGDSADSGYWAMPWSADYLDHPSKGPLFAAGVYANIPFRQGLGIIAAACHLYAAELSKLAPDGITRKLFVRSSIVGVLYTLALIAINAS